MSDTATPTETGTDVLDAKAAKTATDYVVLEYDVVGPGETVHVDGVPWFVRRTIQAKSAEEAIRAYAKTLAKPTVEGTGTLTFVAIPARSWKPVQVTAKVETTLELKPAS